jgi:hypothetical protein
VIEDIEDIEDIDDLFEDDKSDEIGEIEIIQDPSIVFMHCPKVGTILPDGNIHKDEERMVIKAGKTILKDGSVKQRYLCKVCGHIFKVVK